MARRKRIVEEIEPASEAPDVPEERVLTPDPEPAPEPDPRYTVHSWNAQTLYRCTACAWDSFDLERVLEHYEKYHRPAAVDPPCVSLDYEALARARRRKRIRPLAG